MHLRACTFISVFLSTTLIPIHSFASEIMCERARWVVVISSRLKATGMWDWLFCTVAFLILLQMIIITTFSYPIHTYIVVDWKVYLNFWHWKWNSIKVYLCGGILRDVLVGNSNYCSKTLHSRLTNASRGGRSRRWMVRGDADQCLYSEIEREEWTYILLDLKEYPVFIYGSGLRCSLQCWTNPLITPYLKFGFT